MIPIFHAGVMLVGFCELNNWQDLESYTNLIKNKVRVIFTTLLSNDNLCNVLYYLIFARFFVDSFMIDENSVQSSECWICVQSHHG